MIMQFEEIVNELDAKILNIGKEVKTVEQASKELNVSKEMFIKSLLFISKEAVLVIVKGNSRVDTKKLKKMFGKIRMANPSEVKEITGFEVGAVPPVLDVTIKTIIDPKVLEEKEVIGGGGDVNKLLKIDPKKIVEWQKAKVVDITLHKIH